MHCGLEASRHSNTCPECRAACVGYPQRDFALWDVIQMVYSGLGRGAPTYENFDSSVFIRIYAMIEQCRALGLSDAQMEAFWAPMLAELQRICDVVLSSGVDGAGSSVNNPINIDNVGSSVNNPTNADNAGGSVNNAIDVNNMPGDLTALDLVVRLPKTVEQVPGSGWSASPKIGLQLRGRSSRTTGKMGEVSRTQEKVSCQPRSGGNRSYYYEGHQEQIRT